MRRIRFVGTLFLFLASLAVGGYELLKARADADDARRKVTVTEERAEAQRLAAADDRRIAAQRLENHIKKQKNLEDLVEAQKRNLDAEQVRIDASAKYALELLNENKALTGLKQKKAESDAKTAESDAKTAELRRELAAAELRAAEAKEKVERAARESTQARKEVERAESKVGPPPGTISTRIDRGTVLKVRGPINQGVMTKDAAGTLENLSIFAADESVTVVDKDDRRFLIVGVTGRTRGWLLWSDFHKFFDNP